VCTAIHGHSAIQVLLGKLLLKILPECPDFRLGCLLRNTRLEAPFDLPGKVSARFNRVLTVTSQTLRHHRRDKKVRAQVVQADKAFWGNPDNVEIQAVDTHAAAHNR